MVPKTKKVFSDLDMSLEEAELVPEAAVTVKEIWIRQRLPTRIEIDEVPLLHPCRCSSIPRVNQLSQCLFALSRYEGSQWACLYELRSRNDGSAAHRQPKDECILAKDRPAAWVQQDYRGRQLEDHQETAAHESNRWGALYDGFQRVCNCVGI